MHNQLVSLFEESKQHKIEHACGGVPYEYGDILTTLVAATQPRNVLEVGTALGYTAACMAHGFPDAAIDSIDQDASHLEMAQQNWSELGVEERIICHFGKAEGILPTLEDIKEYSFKNFFCILWNHNNQMKFLISNF